MDFRQRDGRREEHSEPAAPRHAIPIRPRFESAGQTVAESEPIRVLARLPNLETESEPSPPPRPSRPPHKEREKGRLFSSRFAMPLVAGAGLLLLLVALKPALLGKKEAADGAADREPSAWQATGRESWAATPGVIGATANAPSKAVTIAQREPAAQPNGGHVAAASHIAPPGASDYPVGESETPGFELPDGVQGMPIPFMMADRNGAPTHDPGSATPQMSVNRAMTLDQKAGPRPLPSHTNEAWTGSQESESVRLQGTIARPPVRITNDYYRSSVH